MEVLTNMKTFVKSSKNYKKQREERDSESRFYRKFKNTGRKYENT